MLLSFYKLQASIQYYNEKAVEYKDLATKVPMWEILTADYSKMKSILMMKKIKHLQIQLKTSNQPKFMILDCQILHLFYTDQQLNHVWCVVKQFSSAFKNKLASAMEEPDLILKWGIAATLDPQQNY